jgi:hypothetical protein
MKVIYDVGDTIKDTRNDKNRGIVKNVFTTQGKFKYTVMKTDGFYASIPEEFAEAVMVKGLAHTCPKCGTEFGEQS